MISIAEARARILEQTGVGEPVRLPLAESVDRVLAEDVVSDMDSPPHDKSLVDGFAVHTAERITAGTWLPVSQRITAGQWPTAPLAAGTAAQIMTGAPLPADADAVVMVEQTHCDANARPDQVRIDAERVTEGQHVMRRGAVMEPGAVVLPRGHVLRPLDVGLLAEVGCSHVPVVAPPGVAVLATGDELVDASRRPGPGCIRNSNGPLLSALAASRRAGVTDLGIAPDQRPLLQQAIQQGLRHDVLVLSGGVSAGVLDLVPDVLAQLGVECVFHKVRLKPGKPMWFGVHRKQEKTCLVFGLPGNPLGSLVCFELFVGPVLQRLAGGVDAGTGPQPARLAVAYEHRSDRPTYHPARLERGTGGKLDATPLRWLGSADQRVMGQANGLILFPPGAHQFAAGAPVEAIALASGAPVMGLQL